MLICLCVWESTEREREGKLAKEKESIKRREVAMWCGIACTVEDEEEEERFPLGFCFVLFYCVLYCFLVFCIAFNFQPFAFFLNGSLSLSPHPITHRFFFCFSKRLHCSLGYKNLPFFSPPLFSTNINTDLEFLIIETKCII